jgi:hypothetical protein
VVDALCKRLPVAPSAQAARAQAEQGAERFLAERAVQVGRDRRLGVQRYSTPELLARERQLVAAAVRRRDAGSGQVRPEVVRSVLERHATAGEDQAAMVQDVCRSGAGVSVVVGRAGSGKTWALGLAREAFELDGYTVLGTAPTGIATVGLGEEGFGDVRTVDRLLLDLGKGQGSLDDKTVLVVDEAAMLGTRKLAPLLDYAQGAGAKVILVGDDRQFAPIDAGGGFRALRVRLGASELTQNRRQVEPWEQQALDDVRAGRVHEAIAAYAEHERIRAFQATDERDQALLGDWLTAQRASEAPVIYAHRRAQVDRLNLLCQRLRADARELGAERLAVGDRQFGVGDQVVLGANALARLGVANGTLAVVVGVDVRGRALTVRTTEEQPPRTVRLPGWYLDAEVPPGGSRRVDLAYARTDMRSQGRTERRALLALDGAEDMQGCYVQLSRSKERTDLYLTVGPAPLGDQEAHAHPRGEPVEPEQLLDRVMSRDGSKTLASDLPTQVDVRRLSTRQLREERDRVQAARAECPPDRSHELTLAQRRAAELEQARQKALADLEEARAEATEARGRRERLAARDRLALAEHRAGTLTRQADQAAERAGLLRRHQQQRAGWLEAFDAELRQREQLVTRQLAWQRRVDERVMMLDPPGWLLAELGPIPEQPAERQVWIEAAAELDAYRRVHGLPEPAERTQRGGGPAEPDTHAAAGRDPARDGLPPQHAPADRDPPGGRAAPSRPAPEEPSRPAAEEPPGPARPAARPVPGRTAGPVSGRTSRPMSDRPGWHRRPRDRDDPAQDRPAGPLGGVLGRQPGRDRPGQRRDWHAVRAALERLAEQRERRGRGDRQDRAGHRDRDRTPRQDSDRHERDSR